MRDPFNIIKQRAEEFGNHFQKYLLFISQHREGLVDNLESKGVLDKVLLYKTAQDLSYEMDSILSSTNDRTKQLDFLATYYALQYIILNVRCLDVMRMSLLAGTPSLKAYKSFMKQIGKGFRKLSGCYMEKVLNLHFHLDKLGEFVVLGVGTRADQDDIDVGIIDSGDKYREKLNIGMGKVVQEMLKRACYLHFHISEHVGTQSYSASIEEYNQLLHTEIQDFVIINEMLNAWPIFGSWELYRQFQKDIIHRYYFHKNETILYHEGFLRGILGEIRSLRILSIKDDRLHPKEDALRIIKGIMSVSKTILNIEQIGSWDVITLLKNQSEPWREQFNALEESLIFIETFRFLYQLFICQSEDVYLVDNNDWRNLNKVALNMGYRDLGVIKASNHLLIAYHQYVEQAQKAIDQLFPWARRHLIHYSTLSKQLNQLRDKVSQPPDDSSPGPSGLHPDTNIALEFAQKLRFFRGTQFWDDILDAFLAHDGELLKRFIEDIIAMPQEEAEALIREYAHCGYFSSIPMMTILVFLSKKHTQWNCVKECHLLCSEFLKSLAQLPSAAERMVKIFNYKPILINEFFKIIPYEHVSHFVSALKSKHWDDKIESAKNRLIRLLYLHKISSRSFNRFLVKMTDKHPEAIKFLDKSEKVQVISMGILGNVEETTSFKDKKSQLGDYYDMEFMRTGILTLLGE
ncbi:hypothetical protein ACFL27_27785, partial [candidate division CSSED10-310 bacterium]